ncbi:MAG: DUF222 domain-containing protein [Longimicrobiales bacterium]
MVHFAPGRTQTHTNAVEELDRIGEEIATLAAHVHAATYRLLVLLAEFDERGGWGGGGFRSCAHWLSWRTGIAAGAAREKVRTARILPTLPRVSEAMRSGELSFAKVRAITRVATPQNETELLEAARNGTAAEVERIVRAWRRVDRLEEQYAEGERHESRHLSLYIDDDGTYVVRGRLDPESGALLEKALEAAGEAMFERRRTEPGSRNDSTPAAQRRADALGLVAERALMHSTGGQRRTSFEVVVHVDADALRQDSETGHAVIAGGARVSAETSRRLACDASRVVMSSDENGNTLTVGRRTRTVPTAIRRALEHRDGRCRFPGCELRYCDAHHIVHWADGGATSLDNLVLLCRRHHRAVHEGSASTTMGRAACVSISRIDGRFPMCPLHRRWRPILPLCIVRRVLRSMRVLSLPFRQASRSTSTWRF